jgi:TRAP-type C4-dicarboxylate transport system permease large subunit
MGVGPFLSSSVAYSTNLTTAFITAANAPAIAAIERTYPDDANLQVFYFSGIFKIIINFKRFVKSVAESLQTGCMVLMLLAGSAIFGHFLAVTKIPMLAADWVVQLPLNRYLIIVLISLIYQIGGSFIDDLAFMILATPIFYPAVLKLGFNPLWFGIVIGVVVMIGVVIPPVAINVFVVKNITKVPFGVIYRGVYPFLLSLFVCGVLLFVFPKLATFLPSILTLKLPFLRENISILIRLNLKN